MFTILTSMASVVLGIHFCRRDWSSPSVFVATAVLAAVLGGNADSLWGADAPADAPDAAAIESEAVEIQVEAEDTVAGEQAAPEPPSLSASVPGLELESDEESPVLDLVDVRYPDRNEGSPSWLVDGEYGRDDADHDWVVVHAHVEGTKPQARRSLEAAIVEAVDDFVDSMAQSKFVAQRVNYSIEQIREGGLIDAEIIERVIITSGAEFYQGHALLKFDDVLAAHAAGRQREAHAIFRLLQTAAGGGLALLLLGSLFGYFKLDTATRGYYTRRLQFATAGTILAIVAASVLAAKIWAPWM